MATKKQTALRRSKRIALRRYVLAQQLSFRFFDLPPELRNQVYSYRTDELDVQTLPSLDGDRLARITSKRFLSPQARLISRQFKQEYEAEVLKTAKIVIEIDSDYHEPEGIIFHQVLLQAGLLRYITQLRHITMRVEYCGETESEFTNILKMMRTTGHTLVGYDYELPSLSCLDFQLMVGAQVLEELIQKPELSIKPFLELDVQPKSSHGDALGVKSTLLVTDRPCFCHSAHEETTKLKYVLERNTGNWMTYRRTTAEEGAVNTWDELNLEAEGCGKVDFASIVAEQLETYFQAREECIECECA